MCFIAFLIIVNICIYAISYGQRAMKNNKTHFVGFGRVMQYVLEVAVSRGRIHLFNNFFNKHRRTALNSFISGARCFCTSFKIRVIGAAWCIACFILAQSYNVELISYTMAPNRKPIINSAHDIPKVAGLKLTVDRGYPIDVSLMVQSEIKICSFLLMSFLQKSMYPQKATNESGLFKDLADALRAEPDLRCNVTSDCLKKVRDGFHVYAHVKKRYCQNRNKLGII